MSEELALTILNGYTLKEARKRVRALAEDKSSLELFSLVKGPDSQVVVYEEHDPYDIGESKQFWRKIWAEATYTLEDLHPFRVHFCWRIVREMAKIMGLISEAEPLSSLLGIDGAWRGDIGYRPNNHSRKYPKECKIISDYSLALLPPEKNGVAPNKDDRLLAYIETFEGLIRKLRADRPPPRNPELSQYGMIGLCERNSIRACFATPEEMVDYEEGLVDFAIREMPERGQNGFCTYIKDNLGLSNREASAICCMVKATCKDRFASELEEERSYMVARLDNLIARAQNSLDLRVELGALKQLSIILGLGINKPADEMREILDVVARASLGKKKTVDWEP